MSGIPVTLFKIHLSNLPLVVSGTVLLNKRYHNSYADH